MIFKLFEEVALSKDIPEKRLEKGDVATIVGKKPGVLFVANQLGWLLIYLKQQTFLGCTNRQDE